MTAPGRPLSRSLAGIVAELELRQPVLITIGELGEIAAQAGLGTSAKVIAARLRDSGWLLTTGQRGVYEFAPGAHAGPYGHGDPFIDLRAAFQASTVQATLALHSALWLHGLADRAPDRHEVAAPIGAEVPEAIQRQMRVVRFSHRLAVAEHDGLPVHQAATILVHLATKPGDVRGWRSFEEVLSDLVNRSDVDKLERELRGRPATVRPRLAYLLSGVSLDLATQLQPTIPRNVTWMGSARRARRFDKRFKVADGLLPFDPRELSGAA